MKAPDPWTEDLRRLGLPPEATWKEVESRYHKLTLSLHPDVNPARTAADRFRRITAAYQRLSALREERGPDAAEDLLRLGEDPRIGSLPAQELALRLRYSSSARVRAAAALLLGGAQGKSQGRDTRRVLRAALHDPEMRVRAAALDALGRVGRPADLPALLPAAARRSTARSAGRCLARILLRSFGK
jgi:curved DNA-binding protein CbpA